VPKNQKCAVEDDVLPDGTPVPAGTYIAWFSYAQGRSKKIWGEDAEEFKPERWLTEQSGLNRFSQGEWPAFHGGPRVCLGKPIFSFISHLVLVCLLFTYHISHRSKFGNIGSSCQCCDDFKTLQVQIST
jgi:cytochrome P450